MLASLNFVEKFISLPKKKYDVVVNGKTVTKNVFDTTNIAPILTRQGFEVESIRQFGGEFDTVVVGRIERFEMHPDANRLNVCFVDVGEGTLRQIVCGAQNVRTGILVAVALPGTKLPGKEKGDLSSSGAIVSSRGLTAGPSFEIKSSVIRNVQSDGMLCARSELGLSVNADADGDGIWNIGDDAQGGAPSDFLSRNLGMPVFQTLGLEDTLMELAVTPNRPDVLCQRGVARELAAGFRYNEIEFETKSFDFSANSIVSETTILKDVAKNAEGECAGIKFEAFNYIQSNAFFVLIELTQAQNKTPAWLRNLLEPLNQNSINLIVDISNFILVAYGQPNHTFDLDSLDAQNPTHKKLILRRAHPNEPFLGLDGKERTLHEADCVVSDSSLSQALLGVVGGEHSKIKNSTQKIVVEFANPNQTAVRHTARRHSKHTVASFMFEKGIDASARFHAAAEFIALFSHLMHHHIKYCTSVHSKDSESNPVVQTTFQNTWIPLYEEDQKKILGTELIPFSKQVELLNALGFETLPNETNVMVSVPSWRTSDVVATADLVEEFIRIVGIDHVPAVPMDILATVNNDDPHIPLLRKASSQLCSLGYNQVVGLNFMRADDYQKLNLPSPDALGIPVAILNPVLGDEPFMQTTLIPDLLRKVERNLNYGVKSGQMFSSARVFYKEINVEKPFEVKKIAGVCFGQKMPKTWQNSSAQPWSLQDVMMHLSALSETLGVRVSFSDIRQPTSDNRHPTTDISHPTTDIRPQTTDIRYLTTDTRFSSALHLKKQISFDFGWAGELHPKVKRAYNIDNTDVYLFEINFDELLRVRHTSQTPTRKSYSLPRFPLLSRDFSFILAEDVSAKEIEHCVRAALNHVFENVLFAALKTVQIFDIYRGEGVGGNKKSMTFKVIVEPEQRTFTESEIQTLSNCVTEAVTKQLGGEQRT